MPPSSASLAKDLANPNFNGEISTTDYVAAANEAFVRGDIATMRDNLAAAVHLSPGDAGLWIALGHAELNIGDLEAALDAYSTAAHLRPELITAQTSRALVLQLLGRPADQSASQWAPKWRPASRAR